MTLADLAASCDVFYIGGTKVGACSERRWSSPAQRPRALYDRCEAAGRLLAKGWLLGVQFDACSPMDSTRSWAKMPSRRRSG